jgi:hypothetical protein
MRSAFQILVGTPEEKRPLVRLRHGWEDNIKMNIKGVGFVDVD